MAHSTSMVGRNPVAVLTFAGLALAAGPGRAQSYHGNAVPVVMKANPIEFLEPAGLRFLTLTFGHEGPMPIDLPSGTPLVMNREYFVEAEIFGIESAANVRFELVDAAGNSLQTLIMRKSSDASSDGEFYGFLRVPNQAFRAVVSGMTRSGAAYRSAGRKLFQPVSTRPPDQVELPPGVPPSEIQHMQAAVTAARGQLQADAAQYAADHPDGVIVLARAAVSPIAYEPLNSPTGRPIGIRLRYSIRFSTRQALDAIPTVLSMYQQSEWRGMSEMKPLGGTITPAPKMSFEGEPLRDVIVFHGGATYEANTSYTFVVDMIPGYVLQGTETGRFCINEQGITNRAAWEAMMSSEAAVPYPVQIRQTDTAANIPTFFPQRTFHESFLADGAIDCGLTRNTRF